MKNFIIKHRFTIAYILSIILALALVVNIFILSLIFEGTHNFIFFMLVVNILVSYGIITYILFSLYKKIFKIE